MPTPTYDLIASNVLSSSASSVTFSSISGSYRDLVLVVNASATNEDNANITFNSDTGFNYNRVSMYGDGGSTYSDSGNTQNIRACIFSNSQRSLCITQILDYSATDKHKSALIRFDKADSLSGASAARWASTSAITSITFTAGTGSFNSGGTFYLYGLVS